MKGKRRKDAEDDDDGDVSDFNLSEDEGFTGNDKLLLERHRNNMQRKRNDSEEELFAFDDSDAETKEVDMESDIEGAGDDTDLPDVRAWGQNKKAFYSTDYVDQDYGGLGAQEEEAAEMEEAEARTIQKRLAEQLKDADFSLDVFTINKKPAQPADEEDKSVKEQIKTDLSKLSKRQKLELLQKESPEFAGLVEEFKGCVKKLQEQLEPLRDLVVDGTIPPCPAADLIKTQHELVLNYCSNLSFYLLLKARRTSVQAHPVVRRLVQYRQLLEQLEKSMPPAMLEQMDTILELAAADAAEQHLMEAPERPRKKLLRLLCVPVPDDNPAVTDSSHEVPNNRLINSKQKSKPMKIRKDSDDESSQEEEQEAETEAVGTQMEDAKRGITYQIAKNKGLTPYRKKELRNPRVKHRMKFRKANIRRKGQVREARSELQRYGGEMSGIKAGVSKSVKIK